MINAKNNATGLFWCLVFLGLDATQAVYFGGRLQELDSFVVGGLVFGLSSVACIVWTALFRSDQIKIVLHNKVAIFGLNIFTAGAWLTYFFAVQLIEPAIAFALFAGLVPIVTICAACVGFTMGQVSRNRIEATGNGIILIGLAALALVTLTGQSGFVRGGIETASMGIFLACIAGVFISIMLLISQSLDTKGLEPAAQFGFRFPLYVLLSVIGVWTGLDNKGSVSADNYCVAVAIGVTLLAFPIYAVQKAISLVSPLTIACIAATAPLLVFVLQGIEGRVDHSTPTSIGLYIYFSGAILAAFGGMYSLKRPFVDRI